MKLDWDAQNTAHIGRHKVTVAEAEQVLRNDPVVIQYQDQENEERVLVLGQTDAGRFLAVVYTERGDRIRVVTAYRTSRRLVEIYFREK